jgi:peptidoglycan biosynthesis protein MviN/MurJ (putative lipid II flippase)
VVARAFYAQKDTVTPLIASLIATVATIVVLVIGFTLYETVDGIPLESVLGVGGPALGYLTTFLVELGLLIVILRRRWQTIDEERIIRTLSRALAATLVMALVVFLVDYALAQAVFSEGGRLAGLIRAGVGSLLGAAVFFGAALAFKVEEVRQLPALLLRRRA